MGISGLIPLLERKKATSKKHLSSFNGQCAAVDAYCWLHKGIYCCAEKLARGEPSNVYVQYCMKYVNLLLENNIRPILVFDGRHLPAKAETERKRRESRANNRKIAEDLYHAGRTDEARSYFRRCVDVTHTMALSVIQKCREINVDCIVAPYEADSQLAYLNLENIAQFVITEDSDLLLFGCSKVLFKLDSTGYGTLVQKESLHLTMPCRPENFKFDNFRYMCILSGCDYLPSLPGIGLIKAGLFMSKTSDPDIQRALKRLPGCLNMKKLTVSEEYKDEFVKAVAMFKYQPVFDPRTRKVVSLCPCSDPEELPRFPDQLPPDTALQLALGNLDPFSLQKVDSFDPFKHLQECSSCTKGKRQAQFSVGNLCQSIWFMSPYSSSEFSPPATEKLPDTRKKVSFMDVRAIQPKRAIDPAPTLQDEIDFASMYNSPVKRHCPMEILTKGSPEQIAVGIPASNQSGATFGDVAGSPTTQLCPLSPTIGRKIRNPFVKRDSLLSSKQDASVSDTRRKPNFYSALKKFDMMRKFEVNGEVVIRSRYFSPDAKIETEASEALEVVLQDVSNSSALDQLDTTEDTADRGGKENFSLCAISHKPSASRSNASPGRHENTDWSESIKTMYSNPEKCPDQTVIKKSSFDWSQYEYHKHVPNTTLNNSASVKTQFKNPFKKQTYSDKKHSFLGMNTAETSLISSLSQGFDIPDCTQSEHSDMQNMPKEACDVRDLKNVETTLHTPNSNSIAQSYEEICTEFIAQELPLSEKKDDATVTSSPSTDSGCHSLPSSLESPEKVVNCYNTALSPYLSTKDSMKNKPAQTSGSTIARKPAARAGLSRPHPKDESQQSLLARYGFSKKKQLAHLN